MYKSFKKLQFIKKPQFAESTQSTDSFEDSEVTQCLFLLIYFFVH